MSIIKTVVIGGQEYSINDSELRELVHQIIITIGNNNNTLTTYINDLNRRLSPIENVNSYIGEINTNIINLNNRIDLIENRLNLIENQFEISSLYDKILCKYNVTSTSSATKLYDSLSCTYMEIDDVEITPTSTYTFSTTGEHTVLLTLTDPTLISDNAFNGCTELTSITIPDLVTSIGESAFQDCSGLTSITCNATTAPIINSNTFQNVKQGGTLTVPIGSTGYDSWMRTGNYYLGKYNWTKVEQ